MTISRDDTKGAPGQTGGTAGGPAAREKTFELLRGLVELYGHQHVAESLGVARSTPYRAVKSGKLSADLERRVWQWMKHWGEDEPEMLLVEEEAEEAGEQDYWGQLEGVETLGQLEEVVEDLRSVVARLGEQVEAQAAEGSRAGAAVGREASWVEQQVSVNSFLVPVVRRTVVSSEPSPGEDYGEATWMVGSWRDGQARVRRLRAKGDRIARLEIEVEQKELELRMSEEMGLTLAPAVRPWEDWERRNQMAWRRQALKRLRRERDRAVRWRTLRRVLSGGLWKW